MGSLQEIVPTFVSDRARQQGTVTKVWVPKADLTVHKPSEVFQKVCSSAKWQLDKDDFKMVSKIGEGAYGMVYKCTLRGEVCAAKMLKQNASGPPSAPSEAVTNKGKNGTHVCKTVDQYKSDVAYKDLVMELDVLISVGQHPNLVGFRGAYLADQANPIVFEEFVAGPSVKAFFNRESERRGRAYQPSHAVAYYWIQDLFRGIEFLHNRDPVIIHRDLKPGNLMLTKDLCCLKIGDFGMCKMVARGEMRSITHTGHCGTVAYMAPEMYNKAQTHYDEKVDIYSAAMVAWFIATGQGRTLSLRAHDDLSWRPDLAPVGWPALEGLVQRAWSHSPEHRPCASDLLAELTRFPDRPPPLAPEAFKSAGCAGGCAVQ